MLAMWGIYLIMLIICLEEERSIAFLLNLFWLQIWNGNIVATLFTKKKLHWAFLCAFLDLDKKGWLGSLFSTFSPCLSGLLVGTILSVIDLYFLAHLPCHPLLPSAAATTTSGTPTENIITTICLLCVLYDCLHILWSINRRFNK